MKVKVIRSNPGYLLKSSLLYLVMPIINELKLNYFLLLPNLNCYWETSPAMMTCSEMALLIYRLLLKSKRRRSLSKHNKDLLVSLQEVSINYYVGT